MHNRKTWAYIIGVALGDGNLSNPNGRAIRLRVTCDARYPILAKDIVKALKTVLPKNVVSIVQAPRKTYFNISVYSNQLGKWIPWKVGKGTKEIQRIRVPMWIRIHQPYRKECLRGLLQTDGSIYKDRGYLMVNFTNHVRGLAIDTYNMLVASGYAPTISKTTERNGKTKYTIRIARQTERLIKDIGLFKL